MESANSPTGYANPDAVTQIANGLSTTTFQFDNNGNVIQKTTDGTTTTYTYDYANRLTALGVAGATTTYGYDAFGARVLQTGTSTTTFYPFKWYSVASSTGTGAKYSTTTSYMFNGDTLLATVDQQTAGGVATGTAKTRYVHPDHLGSTNVVTDENDALVQTLDYYPYGATRISVATSTNEKRKYIDQFSDDSGLSYLNARFYNPTQGQFLSEDPVFWGKQTLSDPQSFNTYSYSSDNPVTKKDPSGLRVDLVSRPVYDVNGFYAGAHTFFLVVPDHPGEISIAGLKTGIPTFTMEAGPAGNPFTSQIVKSIGTFEGGYDNKYVFGNAPILASSRITPPKGENDSQFIKSLGKAYNDIDLSGMGYAGLGNVPGFYNGNSNNFTYTLGVKSGVQSQMSSFNPNPGGTAFGGASGYSQNLPTTSIYKQIQATITSIQGLVSKLISEHASH